MAWGFSILGSFKNLKRFLGLMKDDNLRSILESYAMEGVAELQAFTPKDSGVTAESWGYDIVDDGSQLAIQWKNNSINQGYNIAVLIQYGHGTGTGGYVQGVDYINPALAPVFEKIADQVWKAVTSA